MRSIFQAASIFQARIRFILYDKLIPVRFEQKAILYRKNKNIFCGAGEKNYF